jgi:hypothetical protein
MRIFPTKNERAHLLYTLATSPCFGLPVFPAAYLYHHFNTDFFLAYAIIAAMLFVPVSLFFRKRLLRAFGYEVPIPQAPTQPSGPRA